MCCSSSVCVLQFIKKNLEKLYINTGLFGDVTFELDDGILKAHRAMLVSRCDVMRAMLNGDFKEAHTNLVNIFSLALKNFYSLIAGCRYTLLYIFFLYFTFRFCFPVLQNTHSTNYCVIYIQMKYLQ